MFKYVRKLSPLALLPVVLWLFMQSMMLTSGITASHANTKHTNFAKQDLIEIVICTPNGLKTVLMTPDGDIHEESETHPDCRWCQMFQSVAIITVDFTNLQRIDFGFIRKPYEAFCQETQGKLRWQPFHSRAPPQLI